MTIKIEPLKKSHSRNDFDCGVLALNNFLKQYALQNQKKHISQTFVALNENESEADRILGFYTLSTGQIHFDCLPEEIKHPKYPVSIVRLARLAVDKKEQQKGIAGFLLYDALQKIRSVSQVLGIFAVVVDAKDLSAKSFYEHYGLVSLQETDLTLCLMMKVIDKLCQSPL